MKTTVETLIMTRSPGVTPPTQILPGSSAMYRSVENQVERKKMVSVLDLYGSLTAPSETKKKTNVLFIYLFILLLHS